MILDLAFLVLMILAVFKGYSKGMVVALFSIIAFIAGLAAAMKLSATVAVYLSRNAHIEGKWLPIVSFLLVFMAVVVIVRIGAKFIEKTLDLVMLGWVNRLAGVVLYAFLYSILFSILVFYASLVHLVSPETLQASVTWRYLQPLGPWAMEALGRLVPFFKDMFSDLQNFFGHMEGKTI